MKRGQKIPSNLSGNAVAEEAMRGKGKTAAAEPASETGHHGRGRLKGAALENSLGYALRRAQLSTYKPFLDAMEPYDIRPSQFAVLALIRSNQGETQSAISSTLGIQKTNFVALLDKLESRSLIERRKTGSDRRYSALYLTESGESFVKEVETAHEAMEKKLAHRLGVKRTRELIAMLHEFSGKW